LQRFLSMVNFSAVFCQIAQKCCAPKLTSWRGGGTLEWTYKAQKTFQNAKRLLAAAVPLQHPSPNAELASRHWRLRYPH
jgi:hypothetical protein